MTRSKARPIPLSYCICLGSANALQLHAFGYGLVHPARYGALPPLATVKNQFWRDSQSGKSGQSTHELRELFAGREDRAISPRPTAIKIAVQAAEDLPSFLKWEFMEAVIVHPSDKIPDRDGRGHQ